MSTRFTGTRSTTKAYEVLHDLTARIEGVSNDLCSAEDERHSYEALTPRQRI
jgi:hypothetical protein